MTNYSINKNNQNFIQNEDENVDDIGSKWSLSALIKYFKDNNMDWDTIKMRIEDIIIKSIISAES